MPNPIGSPRHHGSSRKARQRSDEPSSLAAALPASWSLGGGLFAFPAIGHAAETMAAPVGAGSVLQVLLGLAVVLAMVFIAAWAMRRFNPNVAGSSALRIVAGTAVGNRERVLVLEINDTWIVVGVAPGRVCGIHNMPRPENVPALPKSAPGIPGGFAGWLKQTIERRANHGTPPT